MGSLILILSDLDDGFIEIVSKNESINTTGDPIIYDISKIEALREQSRLKWMAVEKLFDQPGP